MVTLRQMLGKEYRGLYQEDVFDYIRRYPDGRRERNEMGLILQKMQEVRNK